MDIGLERLVNMLNDMSHLSRTAVEAAVEGFLKGTPTEDEVFQLSEKLRWLQDEVADLAVELIARYQPVATDLRFLRSCMEVAYGFSRFGRYAYDISQVITTFGDLHECEKKEVVEVAEVVKTMIEKSVRSFVDRNVELAGELEKLDSLVDRAYKNHLVRSLGTQGSKKCDMATMLILRYLERIADHATYIGEAVQYVVIGERAPRK
ncbi:Phosphate-specific transport system accessory protein PhoU [archaeon HR01]|nr:Phosphate-specific transport system accessory protein PhoU [archaeon HR01]